jgi:hypothetical protein
VANFYLNLLSSFAERNKKGRPEKKVRGSRGSPLTGEAESRGGRGDQREERPKTVVENYKQAN